MGLAATWVLLGLLMLGNNDRNETVGFGHGAAWWEYAFTQCEAIVRYLWLVVWPRALVFDYGTEIVRKFGAVVPQALILLAPLSATVYATFRNQKLGFAGCWFFGIIAPSSSIIPLTTQTMAEHRMYLPLISIVAVAVIGLFLKVNKNAGLAVILLVATALGWRTVQRNEDYQSAYRLWSDTISKRPGNARAYNDLGNALDAMGKTTEALANYEKAVKLKPQLAMAYYNRAETLLKVGRVSKAIEQYDRALLLNPEYVKALKGKGDALVRAGQGNAAIHLYEKAVRLQPDDLGAASNLGNALLREGRVAESIERFEAVLRIDPNHGEAHNNLGYAL